MHLSLNILKEALAQQFPICASRDAFPHRMYLRGGALLSSAPPESDLVYVVESRRLPARWKVREPVVLVVVGQPPADYFAGTRVDWICVQSNHFAQVCNAVLQIFRQYEALEQDLQNMTLSHQQPDDVCGRIADFLGEPILVFDATLRLRYCSEEAKTLLDWNTDALSGLPMMPTEFVNQLSLVYTEMAEDFVSSAVLLQDDRLPYNLICTMDGSSAYILIVLERHRPLTTAVLELVGAVQPYIQMSFETSLQRSFASDCLSGTILSMLKGTRLSAIELENQLSTVGWKLRDNYACIVLSPYLSQNPSPSLNVFCLKLENWFSDCAAFPYQKQAVAIVNLDRSGCPAHDIPHRISLLLRDGLLKAGISYPFFEFGFAPFCYQQSRAALEMGSLYNPSSWCYSFEDYALYYFIHYGSTRLPPRHLCHPSLVRLYQYDQENGTDLLHTLEVYVTNNCNAATAANLLYIHRNTFYQRLNRIQSLVSLNLENQQLQLYLQLSIQLIAMYHYELDNGFYFLRE